MSLSISSFKQIPSGVGWMILFFILAETGTHLLWHPFIVGERLYCRFDTSYNYGYIDDQSHWFKKDSETIFFPTQYLNYYKQKLAIEKKLNERRAFVFGGSVSRAKADGSYSLYLKSILNTEMDNVNWTILNLSADGAGSSRMLLLLTHIFQFKPDLIILHVHGSNEYEDERDNNYRGSINSGINKLLYQSHFFVLLEKVYSHLVNVDMDVEPDDEIKATMNPNNFSRWLAIIDANLGKMVKVCRQHHIPVILLGRAEKRAGKNDNISSKGYRINEGIKKHAQKNIFYFDTAGFFFESHPFADDKGEFFADETHWTEEGHHLIARKLADFLRQKRLVD